MTQPDPLPTPPPAKKKRSAAKELPILLLVALLLALGVKTVAVQAFYIPSGSMETTLHGCTGCNGDRVLVNKLLYKVRDVRRGEIVVFNGVGTSFQQEEPILTGGNPLQKGLRRVSGFLGFGSPDEKDFIKRVIGLPGDRVACCSNGRVTVQPAGSDVAFELEESAYLFQDDRRPFCEAGTDTACLPGAAGVLVPDGELWVMGDNRSQSSDSRANGTIPIDKVVGRAFLKVWPPNRIGPLPVPDTSS